MPRLLSAVIIISSPVESAWALPGRRRRPCNDPGLRLFGCFPWRDTYILMHMVTEAALVLLGMIRRFSQTLHVHVLNAAVYLVILSLSLSRFLQPGRN
ncbi:hypothetical protein IWX47DRAFT_866195 [Phyllosticta citricarpa]